MPATDPREARQDDEAIRATVIRLCRPDGYGGAIIERYVLPAGALR
jgi:hypothetical protein